MDLQASTSDVKLKSTLIHPRGFPISEDLFLQAVRGGKYRLVTQIMKMDSTLDINQKDKSGLTALLLSVQLSELEVRNNLVRLLLRYSADVSLTDADGLTPLMHVCKSQDKVDTVRSLIKQPQSRINQQDKAGNTALNWAARYDNWCAVRIIVNSSFTKNEVNLWLKNKQGLSPLEEAIEHNYTETCWVLIHDGKIDTSKLSPKHQQKLKTISAGFPELYNNIPSDTNNNNSQNSYHMSDKTDSRVSVSGTMELNPITIIQSGSSLTPLDDDMVYPPKFPKLPAIPSSPRQQHK